MISTWLSRSSLSLSVLCTCAVVACGSDGASNAATGGKSGQTSNGGSVASTGGTSSSTGGTSSGGAPSTGSGKFLTSSIFYQDISRAKVDAESATVLAALQASGWGDA